MDNSVKATELKITELINNQKYNFRVIAVNDVGSGKPAELPTDILAKDPMGNNCNYAFSIIAYHTYEIFSI